jgi:hypothetical protein
MPLILFLLEGLDERRSMDMNKMTSIIEDFIMQKMKISDVEKGNNQIVVKYEDLSMLFKEVQEI